MPLLRPPVRRGYQQRRPSSSRALAAARRPIAPPGAYQQQQQQAPTAPGAPGTDFGLADPYDFSGDPMLQRIRALGQARLQDAEAAAINLRRQAELDYGDVQARLGRERVERPRALTNALNQQNLFYSGEFGRQQSNLARSLLENEAGEQRRYQERLGGIESGLLEARRGYEQSGLEAEEEAAERLRERLGDLSFQQQQGAAPAARGQLGRALRPVRPVGGIYRQRPRRPRPPQRPAGAIGGY
jgi:hypothetical protein